MTNRGKIVLTIIILGVVGFGVYRWWDKLAPKPKSEVHSVNVDEVKKAMDAARTLRYFAADDDRPGTDGDVAQRIESVDGCGDFPDRRQIAHHFF